MIVMTVKIVIVMMVTIVIVMMVTIVMVMVVTIVIVMMVMNSDDDNGDDSDGVVTIVILT